MQPSSQLLYIVISTMISYSHPTTSLLMHFHKYQSELLVTNVQRICSNPFLSYSSLYCEPEEVLTTVPAFAPLGTGEVVILVPLRKLGELETIPVNEPSAACENLLRTGMLSATATLFGAVFLGAADPPPKKPKLGAGAFDCCFFSTTGAGGDSFFAGLPPAPNKLNVGLGFLVSTTGSGAFFTTGAFFAAAAAARFAAASSAAILRFSAASFFA